MDGRLGGSRCTAAEPPRHQEFLALLQQIERAYRHVLDEAASLSNCLVMDNYAAHTHHNVRVARTEPEVRRPLHPDPRLLDEPGRGPGSASSPSHPPRRLQVRQRPQHQIRAFTDARNDIAPAPYAWTKTREEILKKADRPTTSNPRH